MSMFRRRLLMYQALMNKSDVINYPGLIAAWSAKGKTNDDKDRAILKDLTGNGHDITLNGFAFRGMSGYGGYNCVFLSKTGTNRYEGTLTSNNIHITKFIEQFNRNLANIKVSGNFTINISGLTGDRLVRIGPPNLNTLSLNNGTHRIDGNLLMEEGKNYYIGVLGTLGEEETNINIDILPEYPDALVFDGVNDYGVNKDMPILDDFTLITKIYSFNTYPSRGIITKDDGDYTKGIFSIRQESVLIKGVSNAINFTNGITYLNLNTYNGNSINVGTGEDVSTINIGCIRYGNYFSTMAFYSAYLFDRSLDEQEIKAFIRKYIDANYVLPSEQTT